MLPGNRLYVIRTFQYPTSFSLVSFPLPACLNLRRDIFRLYESWNRPFSYAPPRLPMHDQQFDPPALLTPEQALLVLCLLFGSLLVLVKYNSLDTSAMFLEFFSRYISWGPPKGDDFPKHREKKHRPRTRAERLGFAGGTHVGRLGPC